MDCHGQRNAYRPDGCSVVVCFYHFGSAQIIFQKLMAPHQAYTIHKFIYQRITTMNTLHNQENRQHNGALSTRRHHVSQESMQRPFKPTIKVGYQPPEVAPVSTRRYKKPVIVTPQPPTTERHGKRLITGSNQTNSGIFFDINQRPASKDEGRLSLYHKKGVIEAHQKYYGGKAIDKQLKQQFTFCRSKSAYLVNNSMPKARGLPPKAETKRLWDNNISSIKDIIQYRHAGAYKPSKVATKCNNQKAEIRTVKYADLHEYDYRKLKPGMR